MMRADTFARSLYCKDSVSFWKDVRQLNSSSIPLAAKVGDAVGNKNIIHLGQEHFSTLLNSVHNTDSKEFVCEQIEIGLSSVRKTTVSASDVLNSLKSLNWVKLRVQMGCLLNMRLFIIIIYCYVDSWAHTFCLITRCTQGVCVFFLEQGSGPVTMLVCINLTTTEQIV